MSYTFGAKQRADLMALLATATTSNNYTPVYNYLICQISTFQNPNVTPSNVTATDIATAVPASDVDTAAWQWVVGACDVNSNTGFSAEFIREYTSEQYALRYGVSMPTGLLQAASNNIIIAVVNDILNKDSANPNPTFALPSIHSIAVNDAGAVAAT